MVTGAIAGFLAKLALSSDGGSVFNNFGELREVVITHTEDLIEATSHDSAPEREFIGGLRTFTGTAEGLYIAVDTAQDDLFAALNGSTILKMRMRPQTLSGGEEFTGDIRLTSWELSGPNDDAAAVSVEFQGTGKVTKANQA